MKELPSTVLSQTTITTNGTIRIKNDDVLETLASVGRLRVSVEGHSRAQQRSVRRTGLKPILRNTHLYKSAGASVTMRITLSSVNAETLVSDTLPFYVQEGLGHIQVYEYQAVGRGATNAGFAWNKPIEQLLDQLVDFTPDHAADVSIMLPVRRLAEVSSRRRALESVGWDIVQPATRPSLSIHPNGTVFACPWSSGDSDVVTKLGQDLGVLASLIEEGRFDHLCGHCTRVTLHRAWTERSA